MRLGSTSPSRPELFRAEERPGASPGGLLSAFLLGVIVLSGPCALGAVRPWAELPILGAVALLFLIQVARFAAPPPIGSLRQIDVIDLSVLLFVFYALVRWLTSPTEFFSRLEVLSVIGYAIVFLFCRYGLARRTYGIILLVLLVALGVGEVIFGYLFHLHSTAGDPASLWFPFGPSERMQIFWAPRWLGTYGCPNHYVSLLVAATGAALALGSFSRFAWPVRIVFFYLVAVLLVGILYSQSRGGWLSLIGAVTGLTFFGLRQGRVPWWIPVAGLAVMITILGGIFATSHVVKHRVADITRLVGTDSMSGYLRIQLTLDGLRIARDHPLFGTGPATYTFMDPRYQTDKLPVLAVFTHDDYLNCVDDYGLVGFALAMFFVFAVIFALWSKIGPESLWLDRVLVAAALAYWSALLVHSFLDFNLHIPANAMLLFTLTGMALRRGPGEDAPHHWSTISLGRLRRPLSGSLLVLGFLYGALVLRTALSDFPYESTQARLDVQSTIESIHGLRDSLAIDPGNAQALLLLGDLRRVRAARAEQTDEMIFESQKALAAYQKALRANPLDDNIRVRMGMVYDLMQRYSEAYLCYQAAVAAQPYNGQFWSALGTHFLKRGLLARAEEAYRTAAKCPHGEKGAAESASKIGAILKQGDLLAPASPVDASAPTGEEPATAP
jgi:hypothetical protein